jgi:hypothetical protein
MFLTRCPRVIPVLWTIINTFVEERTREKFAILKTDELIEYIDEINIPDFLGGQMPVCYLYILLSNISPFTPEKIAGTLILMGAGNNLIFHLVSRFNRWYSTTFAICS